VADHPEIAAAKQRIREMVPGAIDVLEELLESEHDGIRLSASREVLDRGGVPAKAELAIAVDLTIDEEIESMLRSLRRNAERDELKAEFDVEEAEIVEDPAALSAGELVFDHDQSLPGNQPAPEPEPEPDPLADASWQAKPRADLRSD
jgi:hypothetical protein